MKTKRVKRIVLGRGEASTTTYHAMIIRGGEAVMLPEEERFKNWPNATLVVEVPQPRKAAKKGRKGR